MDVLAVPLLPELIVRGAADDLDPKPRERLGVDDAAQRAGTEDIRRQGGDLIRGRGGDGIPAGDHLDLFAVDVAHHDAGARPDQEGDHLRPDGSQPLDRDGAPLERIRLVDRPGARFHALHDAKRGGPADGPRASPGSRQGDDVRRLHPHVLHLAQGGPDVLAGDVDPAEPVDEPPQGAEQHLALLAPRVADDHALAAPQVHPRGGVLVGHAPREPERVFDGVHLGRVRPHPGAPGGRAEGGVVDGDDGPQAHRPVLADEEVLVIVPFHVPKDGLHRHDTSWCPSFTRSGS